MAVGLAESSAEAPAEFTVESAVEHARAHHPMLAAARARLEVAAGRRLQAGRLANPSFEFGWNNSPDFEEREATFGFTQAFPLTSRLRHEREVAAADLRAAEAEIAVVERRLLHEVRLAATLVLAARQTLAFTHEQLEHETEVAEFIEAAAARGEASTLEATGARLEVAELNVEADELEHALQARTADLAAAMGIDSDHLPVMIGELPEPSLPETSAFVASILPEYRAAIAKFSAAAASAELARSERYDDVSVGLFGSVGREEDAPIGFEREERIGFRISIPLPFWNRNQGNIASREAEAFAAKKDADAIAAAARTRVRALQADARAHLERIAKIDTDLIPLAETNARQTEAAHREGLADAQAVFLAHHHLLQARIERADELRDFHLSRIRLEHALGLDL